MATKTTIRRIEQKGRGIQRRLIGIERGYYSEINSLFNDWFKLSIQNELAGINLSKRDQEAEEGTPLEEVIVASVGALVFIDAIFEKSKQLWGKLVEGFKPRIRSFGNRITSLSRFDFKPSTPIDQLINPTFSNLGDSFEIDDFVKENTRLITNIGAQTADRIQTIIVDGVKAGKSIDQLTQEIERVSDILGETRARLIARDQTQKLAGQLNRLRQQSAGIDSYIWQTMEDPAVRPLHKSRNQRAFKWEDPPIDGHPGQPIACRCLALPNV
jgi:SPP1 gp7 family putative phage head morphogenesis protein